jgi:hypothetical protein
MSTKYHAKSFLAESADFSNERLKAAVGWMKEDGELFFLKEADLYDIAPNLSDRY